MSPYSTKDAFVTYMQYVALKRHFTTGYDYFKYDGKINVSPESFERRKDKYYFYRLSKNKDADEIILANLVENPNAWIGDIVNNEKAHGIYLEWKKRQQSLSYTFKTDCAGLNDDFTSNFIVKDGQYPKVLQLYTRKQISLETLVILVDFTECQEYWAENISDTVLFPDINRIVAKYRGFFQYDKKKFKKILVDRFANMT